VRNWPQRYLRVTRTGADGQERLAFVGYIGDVDPRGDHVHVTAYAPEKLVTDGPSPFPPPLAEHVTTPQVFDFWWKQLDYVFGLPDPRTFPPFSVPLDPSGHEAATRFIRTAFALAGSALLNVLEENLVVRIPDGADGPEEIEGQLSPPDVQAGFAVLLRQCDSPNERAHFGRVLAVLRAGAGCEGDTEQANRLTTLDAWGRAANRLHAKSLNQLLRNKLVAEGGKAFEYQEEHSPQQLLAAYNYGDLIHWGDRSSVVQAWEADPYVELDRRLAYLNGAAALAHLYIGFAELVRTALGQGPQLLGR
jgi:hypothetical protein